ncbi:hypothetical protein [Methylobacterium sp. WCS2018Hpa-22]|uniref:hypothetical protein n=1 Tax=Methylobacterium sp. WCS2018Hpa-22 TaxID=3073633 RepID=UPI00288B6BAA|nr:hypothetical protein [Methylobacterium sp. WCS2018Hpa-22]
MKALRQWLCDSCREVIFSPEDAWVEWLGHRDGGRTGFRICHHQLATPEGFQSYSIFDAASGRPNMHMNRLIGPNGLLRLMEMVEDQGSFSNSSGYRRVANMKEFLELMRRVQIPHYEEARQYIAAYQEDNFFEKDFERLQVQELQAVIARYGPDASTE